MALSLPHSTILFDIKNELLSYVEFQQKVQQCVSKLDEAIPYITKEGLLFWNGQLVIPSN